MISVSEADSLLSEHTLPQQFDEQSIEKIDSEVLQESLVADRSYPPFHRVAMDGIAISLKAWESGQRKFTIEACQRAGDAQKKLYSETNCIEVMTGAVLPENCDVVIRYEDVTIDGGVAGIANDLNISKMQNVHLHASDYQEGDTLVAAGDKMCAPQWAVAASIGKANIKVARRPRIAVISTGDELVGVGDIPAAHQVRRSNAYAVIAQLKQFGFEKIEDYHIPDEPKKIEETLRSILSHVDVMILSGGVSKGKFDFIPSMLADLNVKQVFHKVKQRPAKPLWFGVSDSRQLIFALPGNPNSALISTRRYVIPALQRSLRLKNTQQKYAVLKEDIFFDRALTYFLPVAIEYKNDGTSCALPIKSNGSGDFASLARSDGFLELSAHQEIFPKGSAHPLYLWKD